MIKRYNQIMKEAVANMVAKTDKITDYNHGSIIHTILDTVSRLIESVYTAIRQGYNESLKLVLYSVFKFERKKGTNSSGDIIFLRDKAIDSITIIPSGTNVSGGGKQFITTQKGVIDRGAFESNKIPCISIGIGISENIKSEVIDTIDTILPSDVISVCNQNAFSGGKNDEADDEYDDRFKIYLNGLSGTNNYAIKTAALMIDSVRSVSVVNHFPPLRDIFNFTIYVDDGTGGASKQTLENVRLAVEGDGTEINQGHLAPGVNMRVTAPLPVYVIYDATVSVFRASPESAINQIKSVLIEYTNSLTIGKSVIISEVVKRIMSLPFVRDVKVPQNNIILGSEQIARYDNATISIVELG